MTSEPGSAFAYCSPCMHLLSAAVSKAIGVSLLEYARTRLFAPLGIKDAFWPADPQGNNWGWGDLALHPRDMARIGLLWLNHGLWNNAQVVPRDWVDASSKLRSRTGARYGEDYGLGWWISRTEPAYAAADGRGGQRIMAVPSLDLVIVTTGGSLNPSAVTDKLGDALRDPAKALPANPLGYSRLQEALAAAKAPPDPSPVPAAPDAARAISGRPITFPDNAFTVRSVRLDFPREGEARATLVAAGSTILKDAPIGLDGVYRLSPGLHGLAYGLRGRWLDEKTFLLDYNEIANLGEFLLRFTFDRDTVVLDISEAGGTSARVEGRVGG